MKSFCLIILLFTSLSFAVGQNYYVAAVKGKVYYQKKILKKRDKIKMKGYLKFSSMDDYVKLSGPGGLYTITPTSAESNGSEFLVAVREELFPKARFFATTANSMSMDFNSYFGQRGSSYTFFEKNHFYSPIPKLAEGEEIGFLHQTDLGLIYRPAVIEDSLLVIQQSEFTFKKINGKIPTLQKTAIMKVMDKAQWEALIQNKDSITHIENSVSRYGSDYGTIGSESVDTNGVENVVEVTFPAEILDNMGPPRFIKRKDLAKDLKFHLKKCQAPDIETFLNDYDFGGYIYGTYGSFFSNNLRTVLKEDLGLPSKYSEPD